MNRLILLAAVLLLAWSGRAAVQTVPFTDSFTNAEGNLYAVAPGVWAAAGSSGSEITVSAAAALTAPTGLVTASGKGVRWAPSGTARRAGVQFTPVSNADGNTVYVSFLLNLQTPPATGSKLIAFLEASSSSTTSPQLGIFVDSSARVGVGKKATSPAVLSGGLSAGTHLVVVRYTFLAAGNDQADLWVDSPAATFGAATPPDSLGTTTGSSDPSALSYFQINTPSGAGPLLFLDEVRLGTTWAAVTPPSGAPPAPSAPLITQTAIGPGGLILRGTNGPPGAPYQVLATSNLALPMMAWTAIATNHFRAGGDFDCTNAVSLEESRKFFALRVGGGTNPAGTAPVITAQPQNQLVLEGQSALFTVTASGAPPLAYQWYFNTNHLIADATNSTLVVSNVQPANVGGYSVVVTNSAGAATSVVAALAIGDPPTNGTFYVSPTGHDANPGTLAAPFYSLAKAVALVGPGDVIYMRGGEYLYTATIRITNSGAPGNRIRLLAWPGEQPFLNFTNQPYGAAHRGILMPTNANHWHLKGLRIGYAGDNGLKLEGSYNLIEQCVFHHCGDTGLQIGFGHTDPNPDGLLAAYNEIVNCDSYMNFDFDNMGSDADGFACKMHPGRGNVFRGCRAWENSDDGWDLFETDHDVVITNCWTWHNGDRALYEAIYLAKMGKTMSSFQGNGNGFKLGGNGTGGSSKGTHYVMNCVAFNHNFPGRTAHGFDQNSHKDGVILYHNVAWQCLYNYFFEEPANSGKPMWFKNNVSFSPSGSGSGVAKFPSGTVAQNNSWNLPVTANSADFTSIAEAAARAPRNPDGSLPTGFARLVAGSDLIDKGVDVGIPYNGSAPDLGAHEFGP